MAGPLARVSLCQLRQYCTLPELCRICMHLPSREVWLQEASHLQNKLPRTEIKTSTGFHSNITIWLFNIAMENDPFVDYFPINTSIYSGFSMAMLNDQRVQENSRPSHPTERLPPEAGFDVEARPHLSSSPDEIHETK